MWWIKHTYLLSYNSRFQKCKMGLIWLKSWLLVDLRQNLFSFLFQLLEAACVPWLRAPSSITKVSNCIILTCAFILTPPPPVCFFHHTSFSSSNLSAFFCPAQDPGDYIGFTCIIQNNLPLQISKSLIYICKIHLAM